MNYKPIALGLLIATCWSPAVADSPSARLPQEPQTIELVNGSRIRYSLPTDAALLITVENQNRGAIVSVLDDDDNTLFRSANWRGIEGKFVTAVLPNEAAAIEITPDTAIAPDGTFSIWSNKIDKRNPLFQAERAMTLAADASLAQYYGRGNESEQTVSYLTDAIARFEQLGTVERLADAHYELAVAQQALQDTRARRSFENAHSYFVMSDDRPGQAAVRNMQGVDAWQQSRYADALEFLRQAEELRAGGSDYYLAHALNNRALVHRDLNQPTIAARLLRRSIQLWQGDIDLLGDLIPARFDRERLRNTSLTQAINAMTNLGWAYEASDQLEDAEQVLNQALRLSALLGRDRPAADARNNLASVHYRKGEFEFALAHISAALEHFEQNEGDKDRASNAYELRSQIYRMTGETPLAKRDLERALTLRPIDKRPLRHAEALRMLASLSVEDDLADVDLVKMSQQVRDITSGVAGGEIINAETRVELGRWYATQGDTKRGIEEIQAAIADIDSASTSRKLRLAHTLADALLRDKQFEASLEELKRILADALIQDFPMLRSESLITQSQALLGLNRLADAQRSAESALAISESIRSQLNDPVLLRSYARMQRAAYETLIEVAILSDEHKRAWLLAQRARSRRINELIVNTDSRAPPQMQPSIVELRRSIEADAVIAQYFLGMNTSHAWFLSETGLKYKRLKPARVIADLVYEVRESISARRAISADTLNQLSRSLLPENLPHELLLMPDGALYDLPFSILTHSELPTGEPLVTHASTRVLPTNWQPRAGNRLGDDAKVTVFADPIFGADDQRFAGGELLPTQDPILALNEALLVRSIDSLGTEALTRLEGTAAEANIIQSLPIDLPVLVFAGAAANRNTFLSQANDSQAVYHIATHGVVNRADPGQSGLILSAVDPDGAQVERFLSANDIASRRFDGALVVLSGCDTGTGRIVRGEGPLSLSNAFLGAGASEVVSTLWRISDAATVTLMQHFYEALLVDRVPTAEALAIAQRKMRADPRFRSPYFWAPVILHQR